MKRTFRIDVNKPNRGYTMAVEVYGNERTAAFVAFNNELFEEDSDLDIAKVYDITNDPGEMERWNGKVHKY